MLWSVLGQSMMLVMLMIEGDSWSLFRLLIIMENYRGELFLDIKILR